MNQKESTSEAPRVLCVMELEQRAALAERLNLSRPGLLVAFEDSADAALDRLGGGSPALLLVGMSLDTMEGLEFVAHLFKRYPDFDGKVVVLPDEGDPFPPVAQYRDAGSGRSVTEETDFTTLSSWLDALQLAPEPTPVPFSLPASLTAAAPPPSPPAPAPIPSSPGAAVRPASGAGSTLPESSRFARVGASQQTPISVPAEPVAASGASSAEPSGAFSAEPSGAFSAEPSGASGAFSAEPPGASAASSAEPAAGESRGRLRRRLLVGAVIAGTVVSVVAVIRLAKAPRGASVRKRPAPAAATASPSVVQDKTRPGAGLHRAPVPAADPDLVAMTRLPFHFEKGSAQGSVQGSDELDRLIGIIRRRLSREPTLKLEVGGHTSSEGPEYLQAKLGEQRAQSVARYLVEHGIPRDRITLRDYAATRPVVGKSGEDLAASRRVTVRLLERRSKHGGY